jgi:hypothetical protein
VSVGVSVSASGVNSVAIGYGAVANVLGGIAVGISASTNSVPGSIALGASAAPIDAAHAFALGINGASLVPGTLGLTINGAPYVIAAYGSLYATWGTSTTLSASSAKTQVFTAAGTVTLPNVATLQLGFAFDIINDSGGSLVVQASGGASYPKITLLTMTSARLVCILTSGITAASWLAIGPMALS